MYDDSLAQNAARVKDRVWMQRYVIAKVAIDAEIDARADPAASADDAARADHGKGIDANVVTDRRRGMHASERVNAGRRRWRWTFQALGDLRESHERIADANKRLAGQRGLERHYGRGGGAVVHLLDMAIVFGECNVAGLGVAQWAGGIDRRVGIAHDLTTDPLRQLTKDDGHGSFLSSVVQTGRRATAQGYRARIVT